MTTPQEYKEDILNKLSGLTNYVTALSDILTDANLMNPDEELAKIENQILMIQGQKEFVRMAIQSMKDTYAK